jgi:hypothetical protein
MAAIANNYPTDHHQCTCDCFRSGVNKNDVFPLTIRAGEVRRILLHKRPIRFLAAAVDNK